MTHEELVEYYTKRLVTVIAMWGNQGDRGKDYIDNAKEQLEDVKNGRGW